MRTSAFVKYVLSFYGKGGIFAGRGKGWRFKPAMRHSEAVYAAGLLERAAAAGDYSWGDGDSMDRETVRDIVILLRSGGNATHLTEHTSGDALRVFLKYAHKRWQMSRLRSV